MGDFAHLHVHTEYSLLDGFSTIKGLMARARELEQPAMGISDHGTLHGVMEFYRAAKTNNIHPVIGTEAYLAKRTRFHKDKEDRKSYHLLLFAKDNDGYNNLMKMSSLAQLEGYYYRPRIDRDLLQEHSKGIIATSGCFGADIPSAILQDDETRALELIKWYQDIFGDDFYLELQYRKKSEGQEQINRFLVEASKRPDINSKLIVTSDSHYTYPQQADLHDTLLCMQTGAKKTAPTSGPESRMAFDEDTYYIVDDKELAIAFKDVPEALSNTLEIAAKCQVDLSREGYYLPQFDVPEGFDNDSYLRHLCNIGLEWRYGEDHTSSKVREQFEHELDIISTMGFSKYFLVVWDIVEFARSKDIWFSTRGSACASIVAYSLGISSIDPLSLGLYFERFLNPHRISMPDIDLDIEDKRRAEIFRYLIDRFGNDRVAGIVTFSRLGPKSTFRDVARTLDLPLDIVNSAVKHIDSNDVKDSLSIFMNNPEFSDIVSQHKELKEVVETGSSIQGRVRQTSTHPAGIIIGDTTLYRRIPLNRLKSGTQFEGGITSVTQFDMETSESVGLLKVDFLGLRNISIIRNACDLVAERHGIRWSLDDIPYMHTGDPKNDALVDAGLALISQGETGGLFQIEGDGMTSMLKKMQPKTLANIVAALALYRPGPIEFIDTYIARMHGKEEVKYRHPKMKEILADTYGIIVFQEQILAICSKLFGYTPAEADMMRRTVSKKKQKEMDEHRLKIRKQAPQYGVDEVSAMKIFDDIAFFANYGFNQAHSTIYAAIAVKEGVVKAQYPLEYMAALLSESGIEAFGKYLTYCKNNGITVLPPDVNYSGMGFNVEDGHDTPSLRCGLQSIKYVGRDAIQEIRRARQLFAENKFPSLRDFLYKVDMTKLGKRALESLIDVGAFDSFAERYVLRAALPGILKYSRSMHKRRQQDAEMGQLSLFEGQESLLPDFKLEEFLPLGVSIEQEDELERLAKELELIGFYISARPIDKYRHIFATMPMGDIASLVEGDPDNNDYVGTLQRVGGEIIGIKAITTKKGKPMGFLTLKDYHDTAAEISITVFPRQWAKYSNIFRVGQVLLISGQLDYGYNRYSIIMDYPQFVENMV